MEQPMKRKRESGLPRVTYHAENRTFERLFKEESLADIKASVKQKLGLPSTADVKLAQIRGDKVVDLDDDDDFDAFCDVATSSATIEVKVTVVPSSAANNDHPPRETPSRAPDGEPQKKRRKKAQGDEQSGSTAKRSVARPKASGSAPNAADNETDTPTTTSMDSHIAPDQSLAPQASSSSTTAVEVTPSAQPEPPKVKRSRGRPPKTVKTDTVSAPQPPTGDDSVEIAHEETAPLAEPEPPKKRRGRPPKSAKTNTITAVPHSNDPPQGSDNVEDSAVVATKKKAPPKRKAAEKEPDQGTILQSVADFKNSVQKTIARQKEMMAQLVTLTPPPEATLPPNQVKKTNQTTTTKTKQKSKPKPKSSCPICDGPEHALESCPSVQKRDSVSLKRRLEKLKSNGSPAHMMLVSALETLVDRWESEKEEEEEEEEEERPEKGKDRASGTVSNSKPSGHGPTHKKAPNKPKDPAPTEAANDEPDSDSDTSSSDSSTEDESQPPATGSGPIASDKSNAIAPTRSQEAGPADKSPERTPQRPSKRRARIVAESSSSSDEDSSDSEARRRQVPTAPPKISTAPKTTALKKALINGKPAQPGLIPLRSSLLSHVSSPGTGSSEKSVALALVPAVSDANDSSKDSATDAADDPIESADEEDHAAAAKPTRSSSPIDEFEETPKEAPATPGKRKSIVGGMKDRAGNPSPKKAKLTTVASNKERPLTPPSSSSPSPPATSNKSKAGQKSNADLQKIPEVLSSGQKWRQLVLNTPTLNVAESPLPPPSVSQWAVLEPGLVSPSTSPISHGSMIDELNSSHPQDLAPPSSLPLFDVSSQTQLNYPFSQFDNVVRAAETVADRATVRQSDSDSDTSSSDSEEDVVQNAKRKATNPTMQSSQGPYRKLSQLAKQAVFPSPMALATNSRQSKAPQHVAEEEEEEESDDSDSDDSDKATVSHIPPKRRTGAMAK